MKFTEVLATWWPRYVQAATGPIPTRHWQAVEAVLSCRTPRRGGQVAHCAHCQKSHFFYHACNHRACPACGSRDQQQWAHRQQSRMLPVPYYLLTLTVPDAMRTFFQRYPAELYPVFFDAAQQALKSLCAEPKYLGGEPGFIAVLHTWTRRMLFHPHLHLLVPAVALAADGVSLVHPPEMEYFLPARALSVEVCRQFRCQLEHLHPQLFTQIPSSCWRAQWVSDVREAGSGRRALRYLAAYVKKSAFSERRLLGYDDRGRIRLTWRDGNSRQWRVEAVEPLELIRRWLQHVLPKGLMRVRHYGWLGAAGTRKFRRVRFLLGMRAWREPEPLYEEMLCCHECQRPLRIVGNIPPARGPPLARLILV